MSVRKKILVVYQEGTESNMGLKECTSIKNWLAVIILISVAWKMRKKEKMWSLHSERLHMKRTPIPTVEECVQTNEVQNLLVFLSR